MSKKLEHRDTVKIWRKIDDVRRYIKYRDTVLPDDEKVKIVEKLEVIQEALIEKIKELES